MQTLICRICNAEKPEEAFSHKRKNSAARRDTCKDCHAKQERWYREQRQELLGADHPLLQPLPRAPRTPFEEPAERTCILCKATKPLALFVSYGSKGLHRNICKSCNAQKAVDKRNAQRLTAMQPRICTVCQEEKPAEEFSWKNKKDFLRQPLCKACALVQTHDFRTAQAEKLGEEGMHAYHQARYQKTREEQLAYHRDYYQDHADTIKARTKAYYADNKETIAVREVHRRLRAKFGLTMDDYTAMLERQGGVCAVCRNNRGRKLVVDHCHTSGLVRGLLCAPCNSFLGRIHDSVDALERIKAYLLQPCEQLPLALSTEEAVP